MDSTTQEQKISLDVLKILTTERNTYGLRTSDHSKYHSHCARKIHHLRKAVGLTQVGKAKRYTKKNVENLSGVGGSGEVEQRRLLIPLFEAERAWAHSRSITDTLTKSTKRSDASSPPTSGASHSRHHAITRLSRAIKHASHFLSLLKPTADVATLAQAHAYKLSLEGLLAFSRSSFESGLATLSGAVALLDDLSARAGASPRESALANEWMDNALPLARFCAYKLDINGDIKDICTKRATSQDGKVAKAVGPEWAALRGALKDGQGEVRKKVEVVWKDRTIEVRNSEVAGVIFDVQEALKKLEGVRQDLPTTSTPSKATKIDHSRGRKRAGGSTKAISTQSTYDAVLLTLSDAYTVTQGLVADYAAGSSQSDTATAGLKAANDYVAWHLLSTRIERDTTLISSLNQKLTNREHKLLSMPNVDPGSKAVRVAVDRKRGRICPGIVKVLDGVVGSLEGMMGLGIVEEDGNVVGELEGRIAWVKAQRCLAQSKVYTLLNRHAESYSLLSRAKLYLRQVQPFLPSPSPTSDDDEWDFPFLPLQTSSFQTLENEITKSWLQSRTSLFDSQGGLPTSSTLDPEIGMQELSLKEGGGGKKKGPVIYDIAFNYVAQTPFDDLAVKAGLQPAVVAEPVRAAVAPPGRLGAKAMAEAEREREREAEAGESRPPDSKKGVFGGSFREVDVKRINK